MTLKAYQVGEFDIVAAYSADQALNIYVGTCGDCTVDDFEVDEIIEPRLSAVMKDEDGNPAGTIKDYLDEVAEPQYLFGWE